MELIGQGGFGYSFDSLAEGATPHPYTVAVKGMACVQSKLSLPMSLNSQSSPGLLKIAIARSYLVGPAVKIGTPNFRRLVVDLLPWKDLHDLRDIIDTMHKVSAEIYESKKRALLNGDDTVTKQMEVGKDILSILSL